MTINSLEESYVNEFLFQEYNPITGNGLNGRVSVIDAVSGSIPTETTSSYPPECESTGQTLPYPDSCRKYYECLADGTWISLDCCPGIFDPTSETCIAEEVGGDLCDANDEGCN